MRRRLISALLALVVLPLSSGPALAIGTLDQEALPSGGGCGAPDSSYQTFTAGLTGALDTVAFHGLQIQPGNWNVAVRAVVAGAPSGPVLGSGAAPWVVGVQDWTNVSLSLVAQVTAGTQYALVISQDPITSCWSQAAAYAGGEWSFGGDRAFRTFVTPLAEPPLVSLLVESTVSATQAGPYGSSVTAPVGSTIWRTIGVANNGTSTLLGVTFGDSVISGNLPASCPAFPASLPAGATYSCTFSSSVVAGETVYTATATAGSITSSASVTVTGATATVTSVGSKLGLPSGAGDYTGSTKVASVRGYVTWQANLGMAAAGQTVGVYVSAKGTDGSWGPWSRLTSRVADDAGTALFSWREANPAWLSIRFSLDGETYTRATQARWR